MCLLNIFAVIGVFLHFKSLLGMWPEVCYKNLTITIYYKKKMAVMLILDMLPSSRTLKYKTYLGVFLCPERVRLIQSLRSS